MTEKRGHLIPIERCAPQGQHRTRLKLYCLNRRYLALTNMGAPREGNIGICAPEGHTDCISILQSVGLDSLPTFGKNGKVSKTEPKSDASDHNANQGLPKSDAIGQGNGVPVVVRPVNGGISCEGGQTDSFQKSWEVR